MPHIEGKRPVREMLMAFHSDKGMVTIPYAHIRIICRGGLDKCLTLKVSASSLKRRFSVGTKPLRKMLMPSRTEKGMVTTP